MLNILKYKDKEFYSQIDKVINSRKNFDEKISKNVSEIITNIKNNGDKSLFKYMAKFDNIHIDKNSICIWDIQPIFDNSCCDQYIRLPLHKSQ